MSFSARSAAITQPPSRPLHAHSSYTLPFLPPTPHKPPLGSAACWFSPLCEASTLTTSKVTKLTSSKKHLPKRHQERSTTWFP